MHKIFEREYRREKALDNARKFAAEADEKNKKKGKEQQVDPEEVAKEREQEVKARLTDIDEKFFEKIAKDEGEQEMIRARGQLQMEAAEANAGVEKEVSMPHSKVVIVNYPEGS